MPLLLPPSFTTSPSVSTFSWNHDIEETRDYKQEQEQEQEQEQGEEQEEGQEQEQEQEQEWEWEREQYRLQFYKKKHWK